MFSDTLYPGTPVCIALVPQPAAGGNPAFFIRKFK